MAEYMKRKRSVEAQLKRVVRGDAALARNLKASSPAAYELLFGKKGRHKK
jgi:hypothetical protein